ncbi:MAG: DUF3793 family protein [Lachnospiraceae bacterium]|nr:DUF3793 family protein [Lachnospiraceae bacterium]
MPAEAVVRCLTSPQLAESVQMQMIVQSAPVLKNVKMSCMFTVPSGYLRVLCSFLYKTDVRLHCLCRGNKREVVLLYREEWLKEWLLQEDVAEFLIQYGYRPGSLKQQLQHLGKQMAYYYNQSQEFPHEMGVFLGYPLEDVRGFIHHQGKNCRCIGYWKVYSDVERAKQMFRAFDEAKNCALEEFFSGKNIREIVC